MHLIEAVSAQFDIVLLDTGAGISDVVLFTLSLADEVLVVATPEPTSLTDAYATIKVVSTLQQRNELLLLINQVTRSGEGYTIRNQLQTVVDRYLGTLQGPSPSLRLLAELPQDGAARDAVRRRSLVLQSAPGSALSQSLMGAAARLEQWLERRSAASQGFAQRNDGF
jgi:flagellar biosynthesis protein FlhG